MQCRKRGHLPSDPRVRYAVRMTAPQRKETNFPELDGEEQRTADEWLEGYLKLLVRIWREHLARQANASCPQTALDVHEGTGKVRTARRPLSPRKQ